MSTALTPERFAQLFGFCPLVPSKEVLERARSVNALFDALQNERNIDSLRLFTFVDMKEEHLRFLSNVADCPRAVIMAGREILAPGSATYTKFLVWASSYVP